MRLTWRDGLATLLVATAVAVYGLWVTETAMTGLSTRTVTVIALALGMAACTSVGSSTAAMYGPVTGRRPAAVYTVGVTILGVASLVAAVIALAVASEAMLGTFIASMVALWLVATLRHAIAGVPVPPQRPSLDRLDKVSR
jgi:dipeptide/tripeptide permease